MLISELLDDHWDALKAKEGEVANVHREMEELIATGKAATEEISQLKVDLDNEAGVRSSREELSQFSGS